jgi:hypothetical protein
MNFELTGKLVQIGETSTVGASNFKKREFVIETEETYPQKIKMELIQEKCNLLDNKKMGDSITAFFNLRGSEWQNKFYVNLQAWRIEKASYNPPSKQDAENDESDFSFDDDDDNGELPF